MYSSNEVIAMGRTKKETVQNDWQVVSMDDGASYLVDGRTGESYQVIEDLGVVNLAQGRKIRGSKHFWKLYLPGFLRVLRRFKNRQVTVLAYILENMKQADNVFIGSYREISQKCGVSLDSVHRTIHDLQESGFMVKKQNGVYIISPDILIKGNDSKRSMLMREYNKAVINVATKKAKPSPDGKAKTEEKTEGED